jgi:hypothetical protein
MSRRIAIILHGPPGTGKSTLSDEIYRRLPARHISLDGGWMPGEIRHRGGPGRYADLATAVERVLLIELGCGEPLDMSFAGATRGAPEWICALKQSGREVFGFRLLAEPDDAAQRIEERLDRWIRERMITPDQRLGLLWNFLGLHFLYNMRHATATFPQIIDFAEMDIMTTGHSVPEVADQIMTSAGLR